jgi:hypothetical protein
MKKIQLVETGILTIARICSYKFFDSLVSKPGSDKIVATTPNMAE